MREIVNAVFCVLRGGIAWRLLLRCFPPLANGLRLVYPAARRWRMRNHHPVMLDRERTGRAASPSAAIIDSQRVKTTESGGVRGYDAGKKIKGRKRHTLVNTDGRALRLHVNSAVLQDRDGAESLLRTSRPLWPFVELVFADAGYQRLRVAQSSPIRVEVARRADGQVSFAVTARRWIVKRFLAWIN